MKSIKFLRAVIISIVLLSACSASTTAIDSQGKPNFSGVICDILEHPKKYDDQKKSISIQGKITASYGLLGLNTYFVQDPSGRDCEIRVVSKGIAPEEGSYCWVTGTLYESYKIGTWRGIVIVADNERFR